MTEAPNRGARKCGTCAMCTDKQEEWENGLRDFAARSDVPSYDAMMDAVNWAVDNNEDAVFFGENASGEIPLEFWDHFENVTGKKSVRRPSYFRCAC